MDRVGAKGGPTLRFSANRRQGRGGPGVPPCGNNSPGGGLPAEGVGGHLCDKSFIAFEPRITFPQDRSIDTPAGPAKEYATTGTVCDRWPKENMCFRMHILLPFLQPAPSTNGPAENPRP